MFRIVMRTCAAAATVGCVVYATIAIAAVIDGPTALQIPIRVNAIVLSALTLTATLATAAWLIKAGNRDSAIKDIRPIIAAELKVALGEAASQLAASVTHDVAGLLEQRLHKVAEKTAAAATARTAAAVREIAAAERDGLVEDLTALIETGLSRAHTGGMITESDRRIPNGNVASISGRRDT